jgi:hypothetical protein
VIHIPATAPGETVAASMYAVNIAQGHEIAQLCTQVREARKTKGLATKLAVVHETAISAIVTAPVDASEVPRITVEHAKAITAPEEPSWEQRVDAAKTEADLGEIWLGAMAKRQDTQALYERIVFRRRSILADTAAG